MKLLLDPLIKKKDLKIIIVRDGTNFDFVVGWAVFRGANSTPIPNFIKILVEV